MHIWVPRTKIIENTKEEIMGPRIGVSGAYKIVGKLDDGRTRVISDWFPNIVTNLGRDRWGTAQPVVQCSVGSGSQAVAPAVGDIALGTWVADATTNSSVVYAKKVTTPYYGYGTATFTFAPPGTNKSLTEVGVGWGSGGTNLFSRAFIKNSSGVNTTVTWLAAETLYVYYEARLYPYESDSTYSGVAITGAGTFSGTTRLMKATDATAGVFWNDAHSLGYPLGPPGSLSIALHTGTIGTITSTGPTGTRMACTSGTPNAYVAGTYYTAGTVTWGPNDGNGTIMAMSVWPTVHPYQTSFSPSFTKAAGWTLALNIQGPQWVQYP